MDRIWTAWVSTNNIIGPKCTGKSNKKYNVLKINLEKTKYQKLSTE